VTARPALTVACAPKVAYHIRRDGDVHVSMIWPQARAHVTWVGGVCVGSATLLYWASRTTFYAVGSGDAEFLPKDRWDPDPDWVIVRWGGRTLAGWVGWGGPPEVVCFKMSWVPRGLGFSICGPWIYLILSSTQAYGQVTDSCTGSNTGMSRLLFFDRQWCIWAHLLGLALEFVAESETHL
jgi:hypothetical protein